MNLDYSYFLKEKMKLWKLSKSDGTALSVYFVLHIDPTFELSYMSIGVGVSVDDRELENGPLREFYLQSDLYCKKIPSLL